LPDRVTVAGVAAVWHEWGPVLVGTALSLPVVVVAVVLVRLRRGSSARAWSRSVAEVGMVAGTLPWLWMTLTPKPAHRTVDLVPGPALVEQLTGDPATAVVQVGGNLLVFAAFGGFAVARWRAAEPWQVTLVAAGLSTVVEVAQYVLDLGRVSSVNDVVLNTVGAGLAAFAVRAFVRRLSW
jgi:hypothetical protein